MRVLGLTVERFECAVNVLLAAGERFEEWGVFFWVRCFCFSTFGAPMAKRVAESGARCVAVGRQLAHVTGAGWLFRVLLE